MQCCNQKAVSSKEMELNGLNSCVLSAWQIQLSEAEEAKAICYYSFLVIYVMKDVLMCKPAKKNLCSIFLNQAPIFFFVQV